MGFQVKYSYAHRATNLKLWHTAVQPYEIQYEWTFEPYILGLRACELHRMRRDLRVPAAGGVYCHAQVCRRIRRRSSTTETTRFLGFIMWRCGVPGALQAQHRSLF